MKQYEYTSNKDQTVITGIPVNPQTMDEKTLAELDKYLAQARASGVKTLAWGGGKASATAKQAGAVAQTPMATAEGVPAGQPAQEQEAVQDPTLMQQVGAGAKAIGNFVLPGGMDEVKRNAGTAVRGVVGGVGSAAGIVIDPITAVMNLLQPGQQDYMTLNQSLQSILTSVGVPEPETMAEKILQSGISGLSGAATGLGVGKAAEAIPGAVGAIGKTLSAAPLAQLTGGAGSEAGGEAGGAIARNLNAPPMVQAGARLAGSLVGGVGGGMMNDPMTPGIVSAAKEADIPLYTTDVFPPQTAFGKNMQKYGDMMPIVGTGGQRVAQQKKRVSQVEDIISEYGATDLEGISAEVMKDLTARVGKEGSFFKKWGGAKKEVIERLSEQETMPVPLARTNAAIDKEIQRLVDLKSVTNQPVIDVLTDWKQALSGQNLLNVETLRKDIGDAFANANFKGSKRVGDEALASIYKPLNEDMGDHIRRVGSDADFNKWKVANTNLSKKMKELELPVLKTVLEKGVATPNEVNKLIFSRNSSDIEALYRNLSPDGKGYMKSAIIAKAYEGAGKDANPDRIATELGKLGKSIGVAFTGDDLKQVNGLTKALNMTRRAQAAGVAPNNGMALLIPAGFGLGAATQALSKDLGTSLLAGATGAAVGLVPRIYDSKPVRNILINLSQVKENTPEAQALLATLSRTLQSMGEKSQNTEPVTRKSRNETE